MTTMPMNDPALLLLDVSLRSLVLVLMAGALSLVLLRASAASRHLVWAGALSALLVLPGVRPVVPELRLPVGIAMPTLWTAATPDDDVDAFPEDPSTVVRREASAGMVVATVRGAEVTETDGADGADGVAEPGTLEAGERAGGANVGTVIATGRDRNADDTMAGAPIHEADGPRGPSGASFGPASDAALDDEQSDSGAAGVPLGAWLLAIWGVGALIMLGPTVVGAVAVRRVARRAVPPEDPRVAYAATRMGLRLDLRREPKVLIGGSGAMPMTWGSLRPVVLLPEEALDWPAARLDAVLMHELAHVARGDCLTRMIGDVARAIHWFNPLVWLAVRRLRVEGELACDDVVIGHGAAATDYARELVSLARAHRGAPAVGLGAMAMARRSHLHRRVLAVLDQGRRRSGVRHGAVARAAALATMLMLPIAAVAPAQTPVPVAPPAPIVPAPTPAPTAAPRVVPAVLPDLPPTGAPSVPPRVEPAPIAVPDPVVAPEARAPAILPTAAFEVRGPALRQDLTCAADAGRNSVNRMENRQGRTRVVLESRNCSVEIRLTGGGIELGSDGITVASMDRDARLEIEEDDGRSVRRLELSPAGDGTPLYSYREDGNVVAFDASAMAWYSALTLELERRFGLFARERVTALYGAGGAAAVFDEVGRISSDYVASIYLQALASDEPLTGADLARLVDVAVRVIDSDYFLAETLDETTDRYVTDPAFRPVLSRAISSIDSDYYRAQLLEELYGTPGLSPADRTGLIQAIQAMGSDYYLAGVLGNVSPADLANPEVADLFFSTMADMDSDYYFADVMGQLLEEPLPSDLLVRIVEQSAGEVGSDYYLAGLLSEIVDEQEMTAEVRASILDALDRVNSSYYRGAVAEALIDLEM